MLKHFALDSLFHRARSTRKQTRFVVRKSVIDTIWLFSEENLYVHTSPWRPAFCSLMYYFHIDRRRHDFKHLPHMPGFVQGNSFMSKQNLSGELAACWKHPCWKINLESWTVKVIYGLGNTKARIEHSMICTMGNNDKVSRSLNGMMQKKESLEKDIDGKVQAFWYDICRFQSFQVFK